MTARLYKQLFVFLVLFMIVFAEFCVHAMDQVRMTTRTDAAVAKYGVTGKGVTVVIMDRGIDWKHPDFIKPDGTTRIKWIFDMTGQNGCDPSNPAPVEYTEAQINAALLGGPPINHRDAFGHGTVTAGLAAGNGRAFANGKYHGMAPEADLVIVKITSDGAPAHDNQPAEAPFLGCLQDALRWADQKISALAQPAVAIANIGVQWGPMDGTSADSRMIDSVFGLDRPGRAYVTGTGDEGGLSTHSGGTFNGAFETVVGITKTTSASSDMFVWYTGGLPAEFTLTFDDGVVVGPVTPGSGFTQAGISVWNYLPGTDFWGSTSGDGVMFFRIVGHVGNGTLRIRGLQSGTGRFDLYTPIQSTIQFNDHLTSGRLSDLATTKSAVVAAVEVSRTEYVDIDGILRDLRAEGTTGNLWIGSADGPTRDGRLGVDVTVASHNSFAAYGPDTWWHTFRFNVIQDGGGWYGRAGAASASGPIMTGAVALMLQLNPTITARQIKEILHRSALSDSFTGPTPNPQWGYGKLDMVEVLDEVSSEVGGSYFDLTITKVGTGSGTVTSSPTGITCGTSCTATFRSGQVVTLTALATIGSFPGGWSGDADCFDGSVTMSTVHSCTARFDSAQSNLMSLHGDINGDGKSDIFWQHLDGSASIWSMNGVTQTSSGGMIGPGTGWSVKMIGDFNGDGKSDVLWQHSDGSVAIWLMNGLTPTSSGGVIGPGTGWSVKMIGDFNGDGKSDLLWQHSDGSAAIWLMNGLTATSGGGLMGPGTGWNVKLIGDFNGDGKSDVLWQHSDGSVVIWLMDGVTQNGSGWLIGAGTGWSVKLIGDFNGDGKSDVLWQHSDGSVVIWLMDGVNQNGSGWLIGAGTGWSVKLIGDFNDDGKSDVLWQHSDGSVVIWLMDGTTQNGSGWLMGAGTGWGVKLIGDFNGDGKSDVLWQHSDGSVVIWLMDGVTQNGTGWLMGAGTGWSPIL